MKKLIIILLIILIFISSCNIKQVNNEYDIKAKCRDGYEYNREHCLNGKCNVINYFADPCLGHYNGKTFIKAKCEDGFEYDKASCINNVCENIVYKQDPCFGHYLNKECNSDSDCAVAGCSSQACVTKEKAKDIITTCEYKPEYACLKLTSCSCINEECIFKENTEYTQCLNEKSTKSNNLVY